MLKFIMCYNIPSRRAWNSRESSVQFSQEYCCGFPIPIPGSSPGIEPVAPALAGRFFTNVPPGKPTEDFSVQFSSVVSQSCLTVCDPMNHSTPGLPVHHQLPESTQTKSIESLMSSNDLILCLPLFLLPSIFPSIRVFSNESALRIRWPKYWSFSFNISPSNEHSGLITFRMDWLDLLAV